ncbi:tubulin-specific chaperone E isoform X2 [Acipenser ruthenus]|nr:tubulin-specific chaperone E isoform X2 [Acipenser ruthenus]XP_033873200.3 tubulin-specific chaperone E isoform X2 [Acipenser ruthenus]XP_058881421.1 tubulin-specific chaperone E isoform X2 [Acipenser ruthenus]XP_058881422.1 tubulin-specific chaperone E isoform X2 [Acipenser ruthenus]
MTILNAQLANMTDSVPCDAVGRRIICDGEKGTVLFVGNVPPTAGLWLGVEWDNPERGKHDGSNEGVRYFKSRHPTSASFIRPKKVHFGVDLLTALKKRYDLEDNQGYTEKMTVGKTEVQMVGFQSVSEKQSQLHKLEVVSVKGSDVSSAGQDNEIQQTTPNIVLLNLSENLLSSWDRVADITRQLTKLKALELRGNRLSIPANPSSLTHAFANLKELALNKTGVNWSEVLECAPMWPALEELYLSDNSITDLQKPVHVLQSLTLLDLSNNPLSGGEQLKNIGYLPRLNKLLLTNTGLSSIHFDDVGPGCKTAMFPSLEFLAVDNNNISQWSFVNELEKLQSLQKLSCLNNPLMSAERNAETAQQLIIAKIGKLQVLNKSEILPDERRGAELDYRKIFGREWLEAGGNQDPEKNRPSEAFTAQHPRYQILIEKYGAPEDGELKEQQPFALKNQLLTITFKCPDRDEKKPIEKKLPDSMTIQKVKGLLYRLLKVPGSELKLTYTSSKMEGKEIEIDNDLKPLQFYSIEDGDSVLVRWS